jgi:hypothetical protein
MTAPTRLERDLTAWLSETAMPQKPDYADDILAETSRTHQRPRWTFVGRWLPLPSVDQFRPDVGRNTLRTVALLVILGLLLAAVAAVAGSRRSGPPPFGTAGNGLLAYDDAGTIRVIDADTLASRPIGGGSGLEHDAAWALDGSRLAFLRESARGVVLVVADPAGRVLAVSEEFADIDSDTMEWSPDGRHIAIGASGRAGHAIYLVDALDGALEGLRLDYGGLEIFWRPPDGRQLLYFADGSEPGLRVASIGDGAVLHVPPEVVGRTLRPLGWTPDGRSILYQQADGSSRELTYVADLQTGTVTELDVSWGHVSNDGTRVVGLDGFDRPCVVAITGGVCEPIPNAPRWEGTTGAAVTWAPDDRWLAIASAETGAIWLMDLTGVAAPRRVVSSGTGSWQRVAP